jgi:hypothetical protein
MQRFISEGADSESARNDKTPEIGKPDWFVNWSVDFKQRRRFWV